MTENQRQEFAKYLEYSAKKLEAGRAVPEILLKEIGRKLHSLSEDFGGYEVKNITDLAIEVSNKKEARKTLNTGFKELDDLNGGLPVSLIVLGARPGMGKTAFMLSLAYNLAVNDHRVGFVSLEMGSEMVVNRFKNMNLDMSSSTWENIDVLQLGDFSVTAVCSAINDYHEKRSPSAIIIDYLQLINLGGRVHNREREISYIMKELKTLSRKLDIPILVSSQLSRAVETRGGDKRPQLSDLRESGSIEQDSDMVWFLYRPAYYGIMEDEEGYSTDNLGEVIIAKNKFGRCDTIQILFIPLSALFLDVNYHSHPNTNTTIGIQEYTSFKEMYEARKAAAEAKDNEEEMPF